MFNFIKKAIIKCAEHEVKKFFDGGWKNRNFLRDLLLEDKEFMSYLKREINTAMQKYDPSKDMEDYTSAIAAVLKDHANGFLEDKLREKILDTMTSEHISKLIDPKTLNNMIQAKIAFELGNGVKALTDGSGTINRNRW